MKWLLKSDTAFLLFRTQQRELAMCVLGDFSSFVQGEKIVNICGAVSSTGVSDTQDIQSFIYKKLPQY